MFRIIVILVCVFLFSGCKQINDFFMPKRITHKENIQLESDARAFIFSKDLNLTLQEKKIIANTKPKFSCRYQMDKYGQFFLEWELKNKQITVVGYGSLLEKESLKRVIFKDMSPSVQKLKPKN